MYFPVCKTLLNLEDQGFSHLLRLKDLIADLTARWVTEVSQPVETEVKSDDTLTIDYTNPQLAEYRVANYETLGKKLTEFKIASATHTPTSTARQLPHLRAENRPDSQPITDSTHNKPDSMVSLRDLSFLQRREFKIHGGQLGTVHQTSATMHCVNRLMMD